MKKLFAKTLILSAILFGTTTMTQAQAETPFKSLQAEGKTRVQNATLDFTLNNATGYAIEAIYMRASGAKAWSKNLLSDTFEDEESIEWTFAPETRASHWDLRANWEGYDDTPDVVWTKLDLSKISSMTLHYSDDENKTWATYND